MVNILLSVHQYRQDHLITIIKELTIVLLNLVDEHYSFIYINVGVNGRVREGGMFNA
nr:unnamed protein product [Callosobruchus analis]